MGNIAYVDGAYVPSTHAKVMMEDRGYQFADGAYEVTAFFNRKLLDAAMHHKRFVRSLKALNITMPWSGGAINHITAELIEKNGREDGFIYMQVTRGVAPRSHPFPKQSKPVLTMTVYSPKTPSQTLTENGVEVITAPENRWNRCDIKSIALLPNVLTRQLSHKAGARETWLVDERRGVITEGSLSNAYIVNSKGQLQTHPTDHHILGGITRDVTLKLAKKHGIKVLEKPFTRTDIRQAKEAFLTSSTSNILPVIKVDRKKIGSGKPGPITHQLLQMYLQHITHITGKTWN